MNVLTPQQTRELEYQIINEYKIPEILLMENAAHALFRIIKERYKSYKILILCGPGNNGGDGLALARLLKSDGRDVSIYFLKKPDYTGISLENYSALNNVPILENLDNINDKNLLIVDSLFGTGLNRNLDNKTENLINKINNSGNELISVDIPSGINGLNGKIMGNTAIKANLTVTFLTPKIGHYIFPGANFTGELIVSNISAPLELLDRDGYIKLNNPIPIPEKEKNSHKSSYGKVLVIAGSLNYYGAPYFTSKASILAGCGYTTLATENSVASVCAALVPEVIYKNIDEIEPQLDSFTTIVFGPGLGINKKSRALFKCVISSNINNLIIDADGLTLLSEYSENKPNLKNTVLTPHSGEMARLLNCSVSSIEENRIESAKKLSKDFNSIVVLKGHYTIITTPQGKTYINTETSASLSTAGSGDVLSGIIAGLTGYLNLEDAVLTGVYLHGSTGKIIEKEKGTSGILATEILDYLPQAINSYKKSSQ